MSVKKKLTTLALISLAIVVGPLSQLGRAGHLSARFYEMIQKMELRCLPDEPAWARPDEPMLFSFAWASDFHLTANKFENTKLAFRYIDEKLKPDFLVITGDNNHHAPPMQRDGKDLSIHERRNRFLKQFLDENLRTPYVVLPGDNWPRDFEKVFGAFQYSFNHGGMHFLLTTLDRCTYGVEGRSVFDESTWAWMREDLKRHATRPTLVFMHESVLPPSFLDAVPLRMLLASSPNVLAMMSGHVHADLDFDDAGLRQLVCPSLGENHRHGFKIVRVYRSALIVQTIEHEAGWPDYKPVNRWQRIEIPEALRAALHKPQGSSFAKLDYSEIPAHPRVHDPSLMRLTPKLIAPMLDFMGRMPVHGKRKVKTLAGKHATSNMSEGFLDKTVTLSDGSRRRYVVFVPKAYTPDCAWPAILFLHGAGERGTDNRGQVRVGIAGAIRKRLDTFPFITVLPQCAGEPAWWTDASEKAYAMAALEQTRREYKIDPKRTYLTGLSMGGFGTWALAADHPTSWAAIVPVCGKGDPVKAKIIVRIPCWCFHGADDATVPVKHSRDMVEALRAAGGRPRYTEYPGVGHNSWDRAYDTDELYTWLLSHQRRQVAAAD